MESLEEKMAKEATRKSRKNAIINRMNEKKSRMYPFVFFTGVKDNPIPYERMYIKN